MHPRPFLPIALILTRLPWAMPTTAVEIAPRITDREIIQDLTFLKAAQEQNRQHFNTIDKRFDLLEPSFNKRSDDLSPYPSLEQATILNNFTVPTLYSSKARKKTT